MDNVIVNNNFKANTFDIGTNGSLVMNKFDHNYWDKYEGYDLNRDNTGDVPYRPVSLFSMIVEKPGCYDVVQKFYVFAAR